MSYFFDPANSLAIYDSPKSGGEATRTWVYYVGTEELLASEDADFYIGKGKPAHTLSDWGYHLGKFNKDAKAVNKIAVKRNPYERFISTFYEYRIRQNYIDTDIDTFLANFDEVISKSKHKTYNNKNLLEIVFATQTFHIGDSSRYYDCVVDYRSLKKAKAYIESVWNVGLPDVQLPNTGQPCQFTGRVCEFELTTRQKNQVKDIYAEDFENGWS